MLKLQFATDWDQIIILSSSKWMEESYYLKSNSAVWGFDDCLKSPNDFILSLTAMN